MTVAGIHIDLDALLEQALLGVRRASVFLGLGLNAAMDQNFRNYQLTGLSNIQLIPADLPDDQVGHFKEEFKLWVEAGGFRELVESFAGYLDGVHHVCLFMHAHKVKHVASTLQERQTSFCNEGVPNKINVLAQSFGVRPTHPQHLVSLSKARNCLAHRRGVVGSRDIGQDGRLKVSWLGADMFIEEPDGHRIPFDQDTLPIYLPNGGTVCMQMVERVREYELNQKLLLSARELAEICWFYTREAGALLQSVVRFAEQIGVRVEQKQT